MFSLKNTQELDWFETTVKKFQIGVPGLKVAYQRKPLGFEVTTLKSIEPNPTVQLTKTKYEQKRNYSVDTTLKGDNNMISFEEGNSDTITIRKFVMPEIIIKEAKEVSQETIQRQQFGALMRYKNFGKNSEFILETDKPIIEKYEQLGEDDQEKLIQNLRKVALHI